MIAWEAAAGPTVHRQGSRCARGRLRRLAALTVLCWPGSLLPCDQGLLRAITLTLQGKRAVGARQRDMAWTSAVQWIGQACHSGAMAKLHRTARYCGTTGA
jgi:hypothetical protein